MRHLIRAAEIASAKEYELHHPLNPASTIFFRAFGEQSLSEVAGLKRLGVHLVRVPPGAESFEKHAHHGEEEFVYVLSGRGEVELGDETFPIGAGDFIGFPAPGPAHNIRNNSAEDLVYLMGGQRNPMEIADFPRVKKRLIRVGNEAHVVDHGSMDKWAF